MSYQVLARKYRPKTLKSLIGQDHIKKSFQNIIANNKVGHSYLFAGTRGTGKTSVARIFSKALRCIGPSDIEKPCGKCSECISIDNSSSMDVLEIDGASNNSVDQIRSIVENIQYTATSGKYKIYIIDEVHMLTTSAFNALLKTLEEPPEHVVFIMATTEVHKVLDTVLSRCQRFDFKHVKKNEIKSYLKHICELENIKVHSEDMFDIISEESDGSIRDSLSLLDQVLTYTSDNIVTEDVLSKSLGVASKSTVSHLVVSLLDGNIEDINRTYEDILGENVILSNLLKQILNLFFDLIKNFSTPKYCNEILNAKSNFIQNFTVKELIWVYECLVKDFTWSLESLDPVNSSQIILQKVGLRKQIFGTSKKNSTLINNENSIQKKNEEELKNETKAIENQKKETEQTKNVNISLKEIDHKTWRDFINLMFRTNPATAANLEQGNLLETSKILNNKIHITIAYPMKSKVFYDFIQESNVIESVKDFISQKYQFDKDQIQIDTRLIDVNEESYKNFKTILDIKNIEYQQDVEKKKQNFLSNPKVLEAQNLFNSKIEKINIKN